MRDPVLIMDYMENRVLGHSKEPLTPLLSKLGKGLNPVIDGGNFTVHALPRVDFTRWGNCTERPKTTGKKGLTSPQVWPVTGYL
jgi:hypothetical protein